MKKTIDCLFIGHNEMDLDKYVDNIKQMGLNSGAYRDLNLSYLRYNNRPYHATGIFNWLSSHPGSPGSSMEPIRDGEYFSATIAYLGTYLERRGFTFDYVISFKTEREKLAEKLMRENILTIAITTTFYVSVFPILEIMDFIKRHNHTAKVILGGPFISTQCRVEDAIALEFLFNSIGADFYVNSSQGETTLVQIIKALKKNSSPDKINNIYYKALDDKGYVSAPLVKEDNQLSQNPVKWHLFADEVRESVNLRTTISCPFACAFCGFPEHAGKYQTADLEVVELELNMLKEIESVNNLQFIDDTLNVPIKRFKNLLRMMVKNKYKFKWHSQFRCQFLDREMVELMKESGCEGAFLGMESGNNQILVNMNKKSTVEGYLHGIALLKEYDIITYGSFIIGFPGETRETTLDTIKLIKESGIDFYRTQLWYCEPVTPIWRQREKYKIEGSHFEWSHATMSSKEAAELIDEIFLSVKESIWLPQYGFDFNNLFLLKNRSMSWEQVKNFVKSFNEGIKEKLLYPSRNEVSDKILTQLSDSLILDQRQPCEITVDRLTALDANQQNDLIIDFNLN